MVAKFYQPQWYAQILNGSNVQLQVCLVWFDDYIKRGLNFHHLLHLFALLLSQPKKNTCLSYPDTGNYNCGKKLTRGKGEERWKWEVIALQENVINVIKNDIL